MSVITYDEPVFKGVKLKQTDRVQTVFVFEKINVEEEKERYHFVYLTHNFNKLEFYENSKEYKRIAILNVAPSQKILKKKQKEKQIKIKARNIKNRLNKLNDISIPHIRAILTGNDSVYDKRLLQDIENTYCKLKTELKKL